jgi:hypothetical protein
MKKILSGVERKGMLNIYSTTLLCLSSGGDGASVASSKQVCLEE